MGHEGRMAELAKGQCEALANRQAIWLGILSWKKELGLTTIYQTWITQSGYGQREIARRTGVSMSVVSRLSRGVRGSARADTIAKLESLLGPLVHPQISEHFVQELTEDFAHVDSVRAAERALRTVHFSQADRRILEQVWKRLKSDAFTDVGTFLRMFVERNESNVSAPYREAVIIAAYHVCRFLAEPGSHDLKRLKRLLVPGRVHPALIRAQIIGEVQNEAVEKGGAIHLVDIHIDQLEKTRDPLALEMIRTHVEHHVTYYGGVDNAIRKLVEQSELVAKRKYAAFTRYIPWMLGNLFSQYKDAMFRLPPDLQSKLGILVQNNDLPGARQEITRLRLIIDKNVKQYSRDFRQRILG